MKWNNGNRRLMFWLQDKQTVKDDENITKFNDYVKNPTQAQTPAAASSAAGFDSFHIFVIICFRSLASHSYVIYVIILCLYVT